MAKKRTASGWRLLPLVTRLRVVLALVATGVVLVGAVGYARLVDVEDRMIDLYGRRVVPLRALKAISDRHAIDVVDAVHKVCSGLASAPEGARTLTAALVEIDAAWASYRASRSSELEHQLASETAPLLAQARVAVLEALGYLREGDVAALERFRQTEMYPRIDPLTARLNELVDAQVRATDAMVRGAREDLRAARFEATGALLVAGLLTLVVGIAFSRRMVSSLAAMEAVVRAAAAGDLSRRVSLPGSDELARMASDIDGMIENLDRARREIEEHADALAVSEREARAANAAKSVFLSSMSHELRTPLNVILGYAQIMRRGSERSREERQEIERIMEAGYYLLGLIDDVLSIAKIEAGQLAPRPELFAPAELLASVIDMLTPRAAAKGLRLETSCSPELPARVAADASKLRQVLVNLIGNAIKFTERGEVRVRFGYEQGRLLVAVTDTGPGISAAEQARLFESFYQASQGRESAEGTGLGLFISQSLVRLLGGEIRVRSEVDQGAEFSFALPAPAQLAPASPRPAYVGAALPPGLTLAPMLVIDDRSTNRDVLARLLRLLGAEVVEAASGEEGLARWAQGTFSLVWMDLRMPGMDGITALARLRELEHERQRETSAAPPRTRVVAITASVIDFDRAAALAAGFDELVSKPFLEETVTRVVETLLDVRFESAGAPAAEATPDRVAARDHAGLLASTTPAERRRLLELLMRGDNAAALLVADAVGDATTRAWLRGTIESYRIDELIAGLREQAALG